jgi:hypothetical protein
MPVGALINRQPGWMSHVLMRVPARVNVLFYWKLFPTGMVLASWHGVPPHLLNLSVTGELGIHGLVHACVHV